MNPPLVTAAELGLIIRRSAKTVRKMRREGIITADVVTGQNDLYDPEKVRAQLAKLASKKQAKRKARKSALPAGMVPTF